MARIGEPELAPPPALKPLLRPSLRSIGVPDVRDVLAVYLWWLNQQRFRALVESDLSSDIASSVRSVYGDNGEEHDTAFPSSEETAFDTRSTAFDLCGIGGQFD
ncbi:uncharacterized protein N0V89_001185 [Didymosphaeria variabile]|uniref:Uncharacterized protein n=1 Tax=Didymosphaeria variabile TaxID=1932322 RepID=A0A9W9CGE5_9PLEO|nr:uncharacterized protein N0V89_001185 [Didymosphaeria variabile]KAJ4360619.1 hypothetical protein N0V89_001185 [Didymosphaeria variabile]